MADLTPEEQEAEEFEFRARAEEEAKARQAAANNSPANPQGPVAPDQGPGMMANVVGAAQTAGQIAAENPKMAALGADIALAALPQSNIPILSQAQKIAKFPFQMGQGAIDTAQAYTASRNAQALGQLEHQLRMLTNAKQPIPAELQRAVDTLRSRVAGPAVPTTAPTTAPAAGPAVPEGLAAAESQASRQAPSMLQRGMDMASKMRQAAAERVLPNMAGAARIAGGIGAMLTPGNIGQNYNIPQVGRMRGMEINPLTGRAWTPEQIKQYESNYTLFDSQLPPAQMPR